MATSPMQPAPGMSMEAAPEGAPMDPMAEEGQMPEDDGGYTICIKVDATGRISVGVERGSLEEGEYENFTPAKDRKDALTMALEILKADGDESALTGREQMSSAFSSGYVED